MQNTELDYDSLRLKIPALLRALKESGYSESYRRGLRAVANNILENGPDRGWTSYADVYRHYSESDHLSSTTIDTYIVYIKVIHWHDRDGTLPIGKRRPLIWESDKYLALQEDYRTLLERYRFDAISRGLKDRTIRHCSYASIDFFMELQGQCGCETLESISENDVLSYFYSPATDEAFTRDVSSLRAVIKSGLEWKPAKCRQILSWMPQEKRCRKNIQYLSESELEKFEAAVHDMTNTLSLRERTVGILLLRTPLRACDIASILISDIDWENDTFEVLQPKTNVPLRLPLTAEIGNAIYDYIAIERPRSCKDPHLFLTEGGYTRPISYGLISHMADQIYDAAGIRMNSNDRRGTHLFRHRAVSNMLSEGISLPIISKTLGHTDPKSLDAYLSTDFEHLKVCALSIEEYPIGVGVPL